jgi:hypothetical protein
MCRTNNSLLSFDASHYVLLVAPLPLSLRSSPHFVLRTYHYVLCLLVAALLFNCLVLPYLYSINRYAHISYSMYYLRSARSFAALIRSLSLCRFAPCTPCFALRNTILAVLVLCLAHSYFVLVMSLSLLCAFAALIYHCIVFAPLIISLRSSIRFATYCRCAALALLSCSCLAALTLVPSLRSVTNVSRSLCALRA